MRKATLERIVVRTAAGTRTRGWLTCGPLAIRVALGRGGILANKRESDGGTPRGRFRLMRLWYRGDRGGRPRTLLPARPIRPDDAWCEDPADRRYNRPIKASGDHLWRDDALYDVVAVLGWNDAPVLRDRGSAIFLHVAPPGLGPTDGCIGLTLPDLLAVLAAGLSAIRVEAA